MLKKIAHNSTIPALGGNRDLKALQNLIAAEKTVLISLQKLSVDYSKASEALRTWGLTEGDYLGGILGASTSILNHFSSALSQYAAHGHSMREQLKAIRTREESLDDLERRRRSIFRKAEDADKKLSKMSSDNKYYTMQTETLNRLQDDIRTLDSDIMSEEASLDKFKRSATKVWMGLKFGGLVECCQKGTIAGEFGRLAIAEITEELTQPGLPRHFIFPQNKIDEFVAEAYQAVNMVTLSTFPSAELRDRTQYDLTFPDAPPAAFYISAPRELSNNESRRVSAAEQPPQTSTTNDRDGNGYPLQGSQQLGVNESHIDNGRFAGPQYQQSQRSQTLPSAQQIEAYEGTVDDFGLNLRSSPPYQQQFRSIGPHHPQQSSQGTVNPPFSQALPPSQQLRVNEDDFGANVRSTAPPYQQRFSQGTTNSSFSQTLPSSRQLGANEGVDDFGLNTHSTGPPYQRFSEGSSNSSLSPTLSPSQQFRLNEGTSDNFSRNVRPPAAPPYEQQFSQTLPRSQQVQVNEGAVDDIGVINEGDNDDVRSTAPQYQQQLSRRTSFSQTLPSTQQLGANEGAVDEFGVSTHSTDPPNQQRFSQGSSNSSFSQTLPPSQQIRVEGTPDNFRHNVRPAVPPYEQQQISQGSINSSSSQTSSPYQQLRVNEGADDVDPNVHSPHTQRSSQGIVDSSFSQTLPPTQQPRVNEGAVGPNVPSTASGSPHPQQISHGTVNSLSSSQRLPPSQQIRANEAGRDNFGSNIRPSALPQQRSVSPLFSRRSPPSQQPHVNENDLGDNVRSTGSPHSQQFPQRTVSPLFSRPLSPQQIREGALDNVGSIVRSRGAADGLSSAGGRIESSQVQTHPAGSTTGYSLQHLPPISDSSFSTSVANALPENFDDLPGTKISPWVKNQFYDNSEGMTRRPYNQPANAGSSSSHSPLPATARSRNRQGSSGLVNQWTNLEGGSSNRSSLSSQSSEYHGSLIEPVREESRNREMPPKPAVPISIPPATTSTTTTTTALSAQNTNEENNRHVRFGGVEDVDREIERRVSVEEEQRAIASVLPLFHNSSSSIANPISPQFQTSQVSAPERF